jgi:hypothetical protein
MNIKDCDNFQNKTDRIEVTEADLAEGWEAHCRTDKILAGMEQAQLKKEGFIVLQRLHTLKNGRVTHKVVDTGSLEIDGVDGRDAPDFSDAYFSAGEFKDGTKMSDEELNELANEHPDILEEMIYNHASD